MLDGLVVATELAFCSVCVEGIAVGEEQPGFATGEEKG